jgi:uncharacterized membrane protein
MTEQSGGTQQGGAPAGGQQPAAPPPASKTSSGMEQNVAGLLCYVLGWVTGIIFFIIEKDNKFVRFHAMQSIVVFGGLTVIVIILNFIPILGWIINIILGIIAFILWILLMVRAYNGKMYKVPWAGNFAEKQVNK